MPGCRFFPILTLTTESETAKRNRGPASWRHWLAGQTGTGQ